MKTCSVKGCTMDGVWLPKILVWAPNHRGKPIESHLNLPLCELHKKSTSLEDLLTDYFKGMVEGALTVAGKAKPDWRLTMLEFDRTEDVPAAYFE